MKTYLITYELIYGDEYQSTINLIRKIQAFSLWAHPLKNVWLVKTDSDRAAIYNYLRPYLYPADKILIMSVTDDWISFNLSKDVVDWMQGGL